mmetsp:Transcript_32002/g.86758  ORF Transcript_32002/g.86758 Transcript_32002/m.86758 type:complete len:211 (+) Transcript_32002:212-844(+)
MPLEPAAEGLGGHLPVVGPEHLAPGADEPLLRLRRRLHERLRQQHVHPAGAGARLGGRAGRSHGRYSGAARASLWRVEQAYGQGLPGRRRRLLLPLRAPLHLRAGLLRRLGHVAGLFVLAAGHRPCGLRVHKQGHLLGLLHRGDRGGLRELHAPVLALICHLLLPAAQSHRMHARLHRAHLGGRDAGELRCRTHAEAQPHASQERAGLLQ